MKKIKNWLWARKMRRLYGISKGMKVLIQNDSKNEYVIGKIIGFYNKRVKVNWNKASQGRNDKYYRTGVYEEMYFKNEKIIV